MTNETKAPTREEREEVRRGEIAIEQMGKMFTIAEKHCAPTNDGFRPGPQQYPDPLAGWLNTPERIETLIDTLEKRNQELLKFADCWAKAETALNDLKISKDEQIRELEKRLEAWNTNEPCYYCGKPINNLAANPGLWSVGLCHTDEPGVVKAHHEACVNERLQRLEAAEQDTARLRAKETNINAMQVALCSREYPHEGPCNGYPRLVCAEATAARKDSA